MNAQPRTLTQMQNRPTAYEVVMVVKRAEKTETITLGFTARHTKSAIQSYVDVNAESIIQELGTDAPAIETYSQEAGYHFAHGSVDVDVRFSGRTERDVASEQGRV